MPGGQTQLVFGNEAALVPESIRDVRRLLDGANPRVRIRNHRIVSGVMFLEVPHTQYVERLGRMSYVRYYLVAGEDPKEKGCIAAMYLSVEARKLLTVHMVDLYDTRGGKPNIAWCTAFQFKRAITPAGFDTRAYSPIIRARRNYCWNLLKKFDDSISFRNQNWQAIQVGYSSHTTRYRANKLQKEIDDHRKFFRECRDRHRIRPVEAGADEDDSDDQDDNPDPGLRQHRRIDNESDEDDEPNGHDHHPRPDPNDNDDNGDDDDDDDDDDADEFDLRRELGLLRRRSAPDPGPENTENDMQDDFRDRINMGDDLNGEFDIQDDIDQDHDMMDHLDDRSQSPFFVPHSRQTSIDIDRMSSQRSPKRLDSPIQPKLEPKVEPEEEVMTQPGYIRPRHIWDPIDLTEDSDESMGDGSSTMEVIELTEDSDTPTEPVRTTNRYEDVIDLTQDSEEPQSPMEIIEVDD
jgi:hypothetical protein